jgi:chromosome segregation ATPase
MSKQRVHPVEERIRRIEEALEHKVDKSDGKDLEQRVNDLESKLEGLREKAGDLEGQLAGAESGSMILGTRPATEVSKKMTNDRTNGYPSTREEDALDQLSKMNKEALSGAARTILGEADAAAYAEYLLHTYMFQPEEYDEAMEKMRLAATELTDRDRQLLAQIVSANKDAASSIDPDDETLAGYRVYQGDYHWYYSMFAGMVDEVLKDSREG